MSNRKCAPFFMILVVVVVLLLSVASPPTIHAARWFLAFKTANNWMAGYVGDVTVCFHFQPNPVAENSTTMDVDRIPLNGTSDDDDDDDPDTTDPDAGDTEPKIDDRLEDCRTIPWRSFERDKSYVFGMDFIKDDPLDKVRLFTKLDNSSLCKRKTLDNWHVDRITFQNRLTGQLFEKLDADSNSEWVAAAAASGATSRTAAASATNKPLKNPKKSAKKMSAEIAPVAYSFAAAAAAAYSRTMFIGPKCGAGDKGELILDEFNVSAHPRPCEFAGTIYKDGESFDDGCVGVCQCRDGGVGCVSRCPPFVAPGCRHVHVPNECCENVICDSKLQQLACPLYEDNDCETANRTVTPGEFPWSAFVKLCDTKIKAGSGGNAIGGGGGGGGCSRFCSGALLADRWVLSAADCLVWPVTGKQADPDQIRVIVGESNLFLSEDRDIELAVESVSTKPAASGGSSGLVLIKLKERVTFDKVVQPALLPHSKDQCHHLLQPQCGVTLTGWMNLGSGTDAEQYELYKLNTRLEDSSSCPPLTASVTTTVPPSAAVAPRRRKPPPPIPNTQMPLCMNMGNDEPALSIDCGTCQPESDSAYTCVSDKNTHLCSGEMGRTILSRMLMPTSVSASEADNFREVDILVGIVTNNRTRTESKQFCSSHASWIGVGICNDLSWIMNTAI